MIKTTQELKSAINGILRVYCSSKESEAFFAESIKIYQKQLERLESNYVRIAIIGITSSGKSTLLNSILGEKLLPTAVAPSSSKQVVCGYASEKYAKVIFEEGSGKKDRIIKSNILSEISRYGDEKCNPHNREHVAELQVFSPNYKFRRELLFIDTPGLDAYGLTEHEDITMKLVLPSVDMVLFLTNVKCDSDKQNLDSIDRCTTDDKPLVVVQNKIDSIEEKRSKQYGVEKTKEQVKQDHFNRLHKLLQNAKKRSVQTAPIVQVSAKLPWAESNLEELQRVMSEQVDRNLDRFLQLYLNQFWNRLQKDYAALQNLRKIQAERDKSLAATCKEYNGYETHINAVNSLLEEINDTLEAKLNSLLDKAMQLIVSINSITTGKSSFDAVFGRISNRFGNNRGTSARTSATLVDKLNDILSVPSIEKTLDEDELPSNINRELEAFKSELEEITPFFSSSITKVQQALKTCCGELNMLEREIVNIHPVGTFSIIRESYKTTRTKPRTERRKKSGVWNWLKGLFGKEEYETVTVGYDTINCTDLGSLLDYIKSNSASINKFIHEKLKKFNNDTDFSIDKLEEKLESMRKQSETQNQGTLATETLNALLKAVTSQLPAPSDQTVPQEITNTPPAPRPVVTDTSKELECKPIEKAIFTLAQSQALNLTRRYMQQIVDKVQPTGQILICGWDSEKLANFCNYFFAEGQNVRCVNFNTTKPPTTAMTGKLVFLIVNAEQKGSAENKLHMAAVQSFLNNVIRNGKLAWVMDSVKGLANWRKPNEDTLAEAFHEMIKMAEAFTSPFQSMPYDFMACDSDLYYSVLFHELYFTRLDTEYKKQQLIQAFGDVFHLNNERKNMTGSYLNKYSNLMGK